MCRQRRTPGCRSPLRKATTTRNRVILQHRVCTPDADLVSRSHLGTICVPKVAMLVRGTSVPLFFASRVLHHQRDWFPFTRCMAARGCTEPYALVARGNLIVIPAIALWVTAIWQVAVLSVSSDQLGRDESKRWL
jgi:hypothetical protein